MIRLTLSLPCPANRLYRAIAFKTKAGGRFSKQILSKVARQKRDLLIAEVWEQLGGRPEPITGPVQVSYTVVPRDKRTPDVDAYEKHLLDCLTKAGVWNDDKQVIQVSKERIEPKHPGFLIVEIWEV